MKQKGLPVRQAGLVLIVIVVLIAALAVGGYLIYKLPRTVTPLPTPQTTPVPSPTPSPNPAPTGTKEAANWKTSCKNIINNPKTKYKECEMQGGYNSSDNEKMCKEIGGQYISCSSPCRHDPPGTVCIQVCVPLCKF